MRITSWTLTHLRPTIWPRPTNQPFLKRRPWHQPKEWRKEKLKRSKSAKKRWNKQLKWPKEITTRRNSRASRRLLTTWCESKEQLTLRISILGHRSLSLLTWGTKVRQQVHRLQLRLPSMLPMWGKWPKTWTTCHSELMRKTETTLTFQWASLSLASSKFNLETPTTGSHPTINPFRLQISLHFNRQSSRTRQTRGLSEAQATISIRQRTMRDLSMQQANTIWRRSHLTRLTLRTTTARSKQQRWILKFLTELRMSTRTSWINPWHRLRRRRLLRSKRKLLKWTISPTSWTSESRRRIRFSRLSVRISTKRFTTA